MSKSNRRSRRIRSNDRPERRVSVQGVQLQKPDLRKLSRAVIALAQAEAEREAQLEHQHSRRPRSPEGADHE